MVCVKCTCACVYMHVCACACVQKSFCAHRTWFQNPHRNPGLGVLKSLTRVTQRVRGTQAALPYAVNLWRLFVVPNEVEMAGKQFLE